MTPRKLKPQRPAGASGPPPPVCPKCKVRFVKSYWPECEDCWIAALAAVDRRSRDLPVGIIR
jgi:hypothetical protein